MMDDDVEVTSPLFLQQLADTLRGYLGNHPLGQGQRSVLTDQLLRVQKSRDALVAATSRRTTQAMRIEDLLDVVLFSGALRGADA